MTSTAAVSDSSTATRAKRRVRRVLPKFLTLASLDGRTRASRRAYELRDQILKKYPKPTPIQIAHATHAACLGISIEDMEVRALQGDETVDPAVYALLLNAQRRALASI
jgi:hypothetical protein